MKNDLFWNLSSSLNKFNKLIFEENNQNLKKF